MDKKVQKIYSRVKKHLGNSNLSFRVWEKIYEQLMTRCGGWRDVLTIRGRVPPADGA